MKTMITGGLATLALLLAGGLMTSEDLMAREGSSGGKNKGRPVTMAREGASGGKNKGRPVTMAREGSSGGKNKGRPVASA